MLRFRSLTFPESFAIAPWRPIFSLFLPLIPSLVPMVAPLVAILSPFVHPTTAAAKQPRDQQQDNSECP